MSSTKLRVIIVNQKIKLLHQRNNQSMTQLIVYLKTLKKQWSKSISNNLRASNLLLVMHDYFRKKIVRKNVNVTNRKIVKKIARQIKAIEMKSHHKSQNKLKSKQNWRFHANNKRLRNENLDDTQLMTIVIADSKQKKARSAKNLSHIICYICDKAKHYKSQCRNDDLDKSSKKNKDRST
jgi:hypothetical protein